MTATRSYARRKRYLLTYAPFREAHVDNGEQGGSTCVMARNGFSPTKRSPGFSGTTGKGIASSQSKTTTRIFYDVLLFLQGLFSVCRIAGSSVDG